MALKTNSDSGSNDSSLFFFFTDWLCHIFRVIPKVSIMVSKYSLTLCIIVVTFAVALGHPDCLLRCGGKGGTCFACGIFGACCKINHNDGGACDGSTGCSDYHCCIQARGGRGSTGPPGMSG